MIVGITGALRAGKDTAAALLVREYDYIRLAWADQLRSEITRTLRRTLKVLLTDYDRSRSSFVHGCVAADRVEEWWDKRIARALTEKKPDCIRQLLQEWGTELRRAEKDDYWLDAWYWEAERRHTPDNQWRYVIPDTRFQNECKMVRRMGGLLIQIIRPGYNGDGHLSERDLDTWTDYDLVVANTGTVEDLENKLRNFMEGIK